MRSRSRLVLALLASLLAAPSTRASDFSFKLQNTWKLGGHGSWDYLTVDAEAQILYIARLNRVMLVDIRSGKLITEITGIDHAHGIAFDDLGEVGYISDGGAGTVLVFDRATYKVLATIPAGKNPDSILFEATHHRVFAFNGISHDATIIDATSNSVIATIPLPCKPEFSVTDGAGSVFVNVEDSSSVLRLDADSLKITATWSLAPGKGPSGLAIDAAGQRLFSVCDNAKMIILDSQTGKLLASPAIGAGADAVVFDATRKLVFSSNGESGTMTIIHANGPASYATVQTLPTQIGARTIAADPTTGTLYTVSAALGPKPPASPSNPKPPPCHSSRQLCSSRVFALRAIRNKSPAGRDLCHFQLGSDGSGSVSFRQAQTTRPQRVAWPSSHHEPGQRSLPWLLCHPQACS
jgi:YVTN family beta-propeller protein